MNGISDLAAPQSLDTPGAVLAPSPPAPAANGFLASSLVEASDDAIVGRTLAGTVFSWNSGAERLFGHRADEMIGRSVGLLVPPEGETERRRIERCVRLGSSLLQYETVRLRKDGRRVTVQQTVSPLRDSGGRVCGMVVISRDISELKRLQSLVLESVEREQQRIGQDLHDGLSQQLSGITYLAHSLHRQLERQSLPQAREAARILELVSEAGEQTRAIAHGILPVNPRSGGLTAALSRLAQVIGNTYPLSCCFFGEPELIIPDETVATHLYRIAQEAVHNAVKHSRASRLSIHLHRSPGGVQLRVEDDGCGLQVSPSNQPGMGFEIMRCRARAIGATLRWRSRPGLGLSVVCSLTLTRANSDAASHGH